MNESSNQLRNKEKDVVEELKERKTMEGYVVYVQGAGETWSNRFKNIHKSGPKSISEFSTPFNDKHKFKAIREIVQKCNAVSLLLSHFNRQLEFQELMKLISS